MVDEVFPIGVERPPTTDIWTATSQDAIPDHPLGNRCARGGVALRNVLAAPPRRSS